MPIYNSDQIARINRAVRTTERGAVRGDGQFDSRPNPSHCKLQFVRIASTTKVQGRYPGKLLRYDPSYTVLDEDAWTDLEDCWVADSAWGIHFDTYLSYPARLTGYENSRPVFMTDWASLVGIVRITSITPISHAFGTMYAGKLLALGQGGGDFEDAADVYIKLGSNSEVPRITKTYLAYMTGHYHDLNEDQIFDPSTDRMIYATQQISPLTTKGDLFTFSTTDARLAVGANGAILTADSTQTTGIRWDTTSGLTGTLGG